MATDLAGLLEMFKVGPTPQERSEAGAHAMARMGLGILAANRSGPTLQVGRSTIGNVLGQGGLLGMDAYQNQLKYLQDERKAGGLAALQAMQIKKMMEQQAALQGLAGSAFPAPPPVPQPTVEKSLGGPVTLTPVSDQTPQARPLDAPAPPQAGGYQPIPLDRLAKAAAAGVDIKPWIALNNEARPDLHYQDIGGEIVVTDKKTMRTVERIPKTPAPGSRSFEASDMTPEQYRKFLLEKGKAGATTITVGSKEADKKFAEDYVAFATGGYTDAVKQLDQLQTVIDALEKEKNITGPLVGNMPRGVRTLTAPRSVAVQEALEEVAQRNLRVVLGAQYTEREGADLISRAYNPALSQEENAKRVKRLYNQIRQAAEAKLDASRHFMTHGTLEGWRGKLWTMKDFSLDGGDDTPTTKKVPPAPKKGDVVDGWEFMGGDPAQQINWRKK